MTTEHIVYGLEPIVPISTESTGIILHNFFSTNPEDIVLSDPVRNLAIKKKDIFRTSCLLALKLKSLNFKENDIIGISTVNEPEVLYIVLASLYLGLTVTALNPTYTLYEVEHCISISKPKILFCSKESSKVIGKIKKVVKIVVIHSSNSESTFEPFESFISENVSKSELEKFQPVPVNVNENVAFILYSSGTTGFPKGVCLTHTNVNSLISGTLDTRYKEKFIGDTTIGLLPFFHAAGMFVMILNILLRKEIVILKSFDQHLYLKIMQDKKVKSIQGIPTLAKFLANSSLVQDYKIYLESLSNGSARLSEDLVKKLINKFKLSYFCESYGMTELSLAVTCPMKGNEKLGSCGRLYPYMSSKVIDPETGRTLGSSEVGELCFKGPQVMKGYKNNEVATQCTIDKDGWLHTGDAGYYDEDGYLFVVDRLKELIKYKEFQVPPAELEALLMTHPKIVDAAVVGIPNETVGELPLAFVVKKPNESLTVTEVQEFVADKVSSPKRLRGGVVFVKELPKTPTGKNSRQKIKSMIRHKL